MCRELAANLDVDPALVRVRAALVVDVRVHDLRHVGLVGNDPREATDAAAMLNQGNDRALVDGSSATTLARRRQVLVARDNDRVGVIGTHHWRKAGPPALAGPCCRQNGAR